MITEYFIQVAVGLWAWLADLFPDWDLPPELLNSDGMIAQVFALGYGAEPFVNWGFVTALAAIPFGVWVIGITVKAVRLLIGHVPFVGGNG